MSKASPKSERGLKREKRETNDVNICLLISKQGRETEGPHMRPCDGCKADTKRREIRRVVQLCLIFFEELFLHLLPFKKKRRKSVSIPIFIF